MTTTWLARTGEGGYALADCIANDIVALRYQTVPDARSLTEDEIATHLKDAPTVRAYRSVAKMLVRFVHDVAPGDLVVTPHAETRRVWFGEVTDDYEFHDPSVVPTLLHQRKVRWLGDIERDSLLDEHLVELDQRVTFKELPSTDFWVERARLAEQDGLRSPPKGVAPEAALAATRKKGPTPVDDGRCSSCYTTVPAATLTDGRCVDCV